MFSAFWTISDPRASFSLVVALSIRRRLELRTQPKLTQIARLRSIECCNPNSLLDGAIERNQILIEFDLVCWSFGGRDEEVASSKKTESNTRVQKSIPHLSPKWRQNG